MRKLSVLVVGLALLVVAASPGAILARTAGTTGCTPGVDGCLPTPEQCASGAYNGIWRGPKPGALASCVGAGGHVIHYAGGDATIPCGAIIESDVVIVGNWRDPNECFVVPPAPGSGVRGTRFKPALRSPRGVVASESRVAAEAGRRILAEGGNAVDAAVGTMFAYGVARPDNCGIGGRGFLVFRGADGTAAALDFFTPAPAAYRPDSLEGPGIDDAQFGHRVVGAPGLVAGMAAAVERFGSMPLSRLVAPAESLARDGVRVTPELADAYGYVTYPSAVRQLLEQLPADPVPGKPNITKLRLFPEAARIYLQAGMLPYPAGSTLIQRDYADSLALIMREGPEAFYRGEIARLIAEEMRRSQRSPYPGDQGLLTYEDMASYRPIWRTPLSLRYRGTTVLGSPPPSSSIVPMEMLAILEGFPLAAFGHGSADHLHLVAETQKLAFADRSAHVGDPAFAPDRTRVLLDPGYAAQRRTLIDAARAGDYPPGTIDGAGGSSTAARMNGHTTHVSVIDADGNAVAVTCSLSQGFGSGVVAKGTGFLLAATITEGAFSAPGTPNEGAPGKRPVSAQSPLIVVRDGVPILVAGGAGNEMIPAGVGQMAIDVVDFGMDVGQAVDVARVDESSCCTLSIEDVRVLPDVLRELEARGHSLVREGEYGPLPWLQLAGIDRRGLWPLAASDPRGEYGAAAVD